MNRNLANLSHLGAFGGFLPDPDDFESGLSSSTFQVQGVLSRSQPDDEDSRSREKIFVNILDFDQDAHKMHMESSLSRESSTNNALLSTGTSSSQGEENHALHQSTTAVDVTDTLLRNTAFLTAVPQSNTVVQQVVSPQRASVASPQNLHFAQYMINHQNLNSFQHIVAAQNRNFLQQAANYQYTNYAGQFTRLQNNNFLQHGINTYYLGQSDGLQGNSHVQHVISPQNNNVVLQVAAPQNNNVVQHGPAPQNNNVVQHGPAPQNNIARPPRNPRNPGNHQNQFKNHQGTLIAKAQSLCQNLEEDLGLFGRATRYMDPQRKVEFLAWIQSYQRGFKTWNSILNWLKTDEYFGGIFLAMMDRFLSAEFEAEYNASINEGNQMLANNRALLRRERTKEFYRSKFGVVGLALGREITNAEFERRIRTSTLDNFQNIIEEGQE